jgi:hypothetical protein
MFTQNSKNENSYKKLFLLFLSKGECRFVEKLTRTKIALVDMDFKITDLGRKSDPELLNLF